MAIRKYGSGEITGADETYQSAQQQGEAIRQADQDDPRGEEYLLEEPEPFTPPTRPDRG